MVEIKNPREFKKQELPFTIKPLSPSIGAEVLDIDLKEKLTDDIVELIYQALLTYKVIFFRNQDINTSEHIRFAKYFGDLEVHPFGANKPEHPEVLSIVRDKTNKGRLKAISKNY